MIIINIIVMWQLIPIISEDRNQSNFIATDLFKHGGGMQEVVSGGGAVELPVTKATSSQVPFVTE